MPTALYRRYRPETFADVIGQEHVTEPLMQALRTGRVNHAYLFSGPRGCGKTTSARILARCLNCAQGPTPEPCGTCESCVALARGGAGSVDVIEIDAASHGGVDDARDLRERASFGPAGSRYKIYIIDEAHMVTPQGFNALLKIVEEPPEHVKFVFATTEPEKVIGTIRSRTHHYPFRLVPPKKLTDYMERLLHEENVACEPGVLSFVTRAGGGSVRDSLSVLDQLIAGSGPEGLTYSGAASLLGFTDDELLDGIIEAFAAGDSAGVFRQIDRIVEAGADPRRFVEDLLERLRDLIVVAAVEDGAAAVLRSVPADQLERMQQQAASFGAGALSRAADVINAGLSEMSGATSPRLQLELMCARVLLPGIAGIDGYAARLDRMERRLEMGDLPRGASPGPVQHAPSAPAPQQSQVMPQQDQSERIEAGPATDRLAPQAPQGQRQTPPSQSQSAAADVVPAQSIDTPATGPERERQDSQQGASAAPPNPAPSASQRPGPRGGMTTDDVRRLWPDVLDRVFRIKRVTWTLLSQNAHVIDFDGERLLLGASSEGLAATMSRGQHPEVVRQALVEAVGVDVRVEARAVRPGEQPPPAAASGTPAAAAPADSRRQNSSGGRSWQPSPSPEDGGQNAWGDPQAQNSAGGRHQSEGPSNARAQAGDPDPHPAPREADSPEQDEGLRAAAARSSAWASDSPNDWSSQQGDAPAWAAGATEREDDAGSPQPQAHQSAVTSGGNAGLTQSGPPAAERAGDEEPPPDPESDIPPWMEDEPETDAQAVYDPLPPKTPEAADSSSPAPAVQSQNEQRISVGSAQQAGSSADGSADYRNLTPRQRAEKAAREHAQRDEDARRGGALDDASASPDDEDIENSDSVGLPVIKSVLGGTVIKEEGPEEGTA